MIYERALREASTDVRPAPSRPKADDSLDHVYCCDENVSLCGLDLSDVPIVKLDADRLCKICEELADLPCGPECPYLEAAS